MSSFVARVASVDRTSTSRPPGIGGTREDEREDEDEERGGGAAGRRAAANAPGGRYARREHRGPVDGGAIPERRACAARARQSMW